MTERSHSVPKLGRHGLASDISVCNDYSGNNSYADFTQIPSFTAYAAYAAYAGGKYRL
jgi:hypothetical protein